MENSVNMASAQQGTFQTEQAAPEQEQQQVQQERPQVEQPKQDDRFASKFAALSRKEKAIRQREAQIQQRMQELEQKAKQQEEEFGKWKNIPERLKKEPLEVLKEAGLSFEQIAEMALNDGKPTPDMMQNELEQKFNSKLQELEQKLQEKEQQEQQARQQKMLQEFRQNLDNFVEENAAEYELIKANEATDLVYGVIEEHAENTGEILEYKKACDAVEAYLLDEAKQHLSLGKVKSLLESQQAALKQEQPRERSAATLSNELTAQPVSENGRPLSDEESKKRAASLLKWDL